MLARLAENLFWAGRYLERVEHAARVVDVSHTSLLEATAAERTVVMNSLLTMLVADEEFQETERPRDPTSILSFLVSDRAQPLSVVSNVGFVRENIRSVRELVSQELWESTNNLYLELQTDSLDADLLDRPYDVLSRVRERCQLISGVIHETLPRDDGWRFLTLGQSLERAGSTARTVAASYSRLMTATGTNFHVWVATLKSVSGLEAYRRIHRASMDPRDVIDFLVHGEAFPRSVLFNLRAVEKSLLLLAGGADNPVGRSIGRLRSSVEFRDINELLEAGVEGSLLQCIAGTEEVAERMGEQFFHQSPAGELRSVVA